MSKEHVEEMKCLFWNTLVLVVRVLLDGVATGIMLAVAFGIQVAVKKMSPDPIVSWMVRVSTYTLFALALALIVLDVVRTVLRRGSVLAAQLQGGDVEAGVGAGARGVAGPNEG